MSGSARHGVYLVVQLRGKNMITGGCLCKEVRYESKSDPIITRICWCRVCQYLGAGSGTVNVCFPTPSFTVYGTTRVYRSVADSGNVMRRRFCTACGTQLFSEAESRSSTPSGGMRFSLRSATTGDGARHSEALAEERRRFIRDADDLVGCLPIEFEIELSPRPTVFRVGEVLELAASQ